MVEAKKSTLLQEAGIQVPVSRRVQRTRAHESYDTPEDFQIRAKMKELGIKVPYSMDLLKDISNTYSHIYRYGDKEDAMQPIPEDIPSSDKMYHNNIQEFLRNVDYQAFSGHSPLEKACNVMLALSANPKSQPQPNPQQQQQSGQKQKAGGEQAEEQQEKQVPMFKEGTEKMTTDLNAARKAIDEMSGFERECLGSNHAESIMANLTERQKAAMELGEKLQTLSRLKTGARKTHIVDPRGKKRRVEKIINYSDITRSSKVNFGYDEEFLDYKMVTKSLDVPYKTKIEASKQLLYMLIDCSGSMSEDRKLGAVMAVLLNRLDGVVRGECELYVRYYEGDLFPEYHIKDEKGAKDFFMLNKTKSYNMGGTDIQNCLKKTIKRMGEIPDVVKPEIMIVTDGNDHVDYMNTHGAIVHSILVGRVENVGLKTISRKSGGVYLSI